MPIKTLHITNQYHAASGGIRVVYSALLRAANNHRRHICLVVPGAQDSLETVGRFGKIYTIRASRIPFFDSRYRMILPSAYLFGKRQRLWSILREEAPDLIEITDKYCLPYLAGHFRRGWNRGVKRATVVGLSCERMADNLLAYLKTGGLGKRFAAWYLGNIYIPQFDIHLANSTYTAQELQLSLVAAHTRRVLVAPVGVDAGLFHPGRRSAEFRDQFRQKHAIAPGTHLLLYAGRLSPEKNTLLLPQMMQALLRQGFTNCCLVVAGSGPQSRELQCRLLEQAPGAFRLLGQVDSREALADLLANSDLFIHPNPREPFGIAPLEALASELPLIAPSAGGVLSYANSANAWLSEPQADAFAKQVRAALEGAELRQQRARRGREVALEYSWEKVADRQFQIYEQLHRETQQELQPEKPALSLDRESVQPLATNLSR